MLGRACVCAHVNTMGSPSGEGTLAQVGGALSSPRGLGPGVPMGNSPILPVGLTLSQACG